MGIKNSKLYGGIRSNWIGTNSNGSQSMKVENGCCHVTVTQLVNDDSGTVDIVVPSKSTNCIAVKGVSIIGDGNNGTVKLINGDTGAIIVPLYVSRTSRASLSSALNYVLGAGEKVSFIYENRGTDETYVGVSYIEYEEGINF